MLPNIRCFGLFGLAVSDEKIFLEKKNCLWQPCLLTEWDEMSFLYSGDSIDTYYQVSLHLAKRF